jgi:hypothetical protein
MVDQHPHLSYYRRDKDGYHFRIEPNGQFWPAVARLTQAAASTLKYDDKTRTFHLPLNARAQVLLALIFPIEWDIIAKTTQDEITFNTRGNR